MEVPAGGGRGVDDFDLSFLASGVSGLSAVAQGIGCGRHARFEGVAASPAVDLEAPAGGGRGVDDFDLSFLAFGASGLPAVAQGISCGRHARFENVAASPAVYLEAPAGGGRGSMTLIVRFWLLVFLACQL